MTTTQNHAASHGLTAMLNTVTMDAATVAMVDAKLSPQDRATCLLYVRWGERPKAVSLLCAYSGVTRDDALTWVRCQMAAGVGDV